MKWSEQAADVGPALITALLRTLPVTDAVVLAGLTRQAPVVCVSPACRAGILAHLRAHRTEVGGLLIGRAYVSQPGLPAGWGPVVSIEQFLPSEAFRSSSVSLAMGTEIWDRARALMASEGDLVIGWYHSHPDLGAFFSATDRATQRAFFNRPYNIGLVIDPRRNDEAWFIGSESTPLSRTCVVHGRLGPRRSVRTP
jgi:proteasome lid subunit RPN8/RPN11